MACGIIPGCKALALPDIPLVGTNQNETMELLSTGLLALGVQQSTVQRLSQADELDYLRTWGWGAPTGFPLNDFIDLMSPFMQPTECSITQLIYPIRASQVLSSFLFWECRETFLKGLSAYSQIHYSAHLQTVHANFANLQQNHKADFYCHWENALVPDSGSQARDKERAPFIKDLRSIHNWTTSYFISISHKLKYLDLVAAHVTLSSDSSFQHSTKRADVGPGSEAYYLNSEDFWRSTALTYVDRLEYLVVEVMGKCAVEGMKGGEKVDEKLVKEAWWTMVLRGICWYMSVWITPPDYAVPSRFYGS